MVIVSVVKGGGLPRTGIDTEAEVVAGNAGMRQTRLTDIENQSAVGVLPRAESVTVPVMRPLVGMEGGHRIERSEGVSPGISVIRTRRALVLHATQTYSLY